MKPLVINLYGGPGIGKSTTAAHIFSLLKQMDINTELVREYAKDIVWEGRIYLLSDQLYLYAKQNRRMKVLVDKVDIIVTDCPLWLNYHYSGYDYLFKQFILKESQNYEDRHYFLERVKKFNPAGRVHDETQSREIDNALLSMLFELHLDFKRIKADKEAANNIIKDLEADLCKVKKV